MERFDLAIVGAGPAGAAAALAARVVAPDRRVILVDRADFPRDKACGDGIAGHAVDELRALGAVDVADGYRALTSIRVTGPYGGMAAGRPSRRSWVIPRQVFDARIVAAAERAGAERCVHRVRRLRTIPGGIEIDGVLRAETVIGADGVNSTTRRAVGLPTNRDQHLAVAVRGYIDIDPDDDEQVITMVPGDDWPAYGWRFPVGNGTANVGFGLYRRQLTGGRSQLYGRLPTLIDALPPAGSGSGDIRDVRAHHLAMSTGRPAPGRGRVLLAGDAASLINPLSGEGIYYAVLSGRLAAEAALGSGDPLPSYRRALGRLLGSHLRTTDIVARAFASPLLVDAAVAASGASQARLDELGELALGRGTVSLGTLGGVVAALPAAHRRRRARRS